MVNTSQQVGGSIGTALLCTLAGSAVAELRRGHGTSADVMAAGRGARLHHRVLVVGRRSSPVGALVSGLVFRSRRPAGRDGAGAEPVLAH